MSSDNEACKFGDSGFCRPVLCKTQPKVSPKFPTKPPLKSSMKPKSVNSAQKMPESSINLIPKSSQNKLKAPASGRTPPATPKTPPKSLSFSSTRKNLSTPMKSSISPGSPAAAIKPNKQEHHAQGRFKVSVYGHIQENPKCGRVVPEEMPMTDFAPPVVEKKRCGWITSQSKPAYIAYHDEEWGVPVYDQIMLFELLVLAGAQAELSWSTILSKREHFRSAFSGFDPAMVSNFNQKKILSLASDDNLSQPEAKIHGAVNNAKRILEIVDEFGSFRSYLWSFVNHKPTVNNYRISRQVPVKSPKSEAISKDLVKRGFRFVGPTVVYSFMQAAGMVNDHLLQCFRHKECLGFSDKSMGGSEKGEAKRIIIGIRDEVIVC